MTCWAARACAILGVIVVFFGCGVDIGEIAPKATERVYRDGRVYVLNNIRPRDYEDIRIFFVTYDGQKFDVPHNMTYDGEPSLAGPVLITPEPLPGGTPVDFEYWVEEQGDVKPRNLSAYLGGPVTIDGDITVAFHSGGDWDCNWCVVVPTIIRGKQDGAYTYPK